MDSSRQALTAGRIANFQCPATKKQAFLWDNRDRQLAIRATQNGAKSFIFQSRYARKTVRITIGDVRDWDIDKARVKARSLQQLIDNGKDPRLEEQQNIAEAAAQRLRSEREAATLAELWGDYLAAPHRKWGPRHREDHDEVASAGGVKRKRRAGKTQPGPLAALMDVKLTELTAKCLSEWLKREIAKRPTFALRAFRLLRACIAWGAESEDYVGLVSKEAFRARIVKDAMPKQRVKKETLSREMLKAWFEAVRAVPSIQSTYLQGLLLTGARREEMAQLRWTDVDFVWRRLSLRDKVDGTRRIPLTPYLASLLQDLKHRNDTPPKSKVTKITGEELPVPPGWKPSEWVFSSKTAKGGRITEPRSAHDRALEAASLPHLTLHDLRRTFSTLSEEAEIPAGVSAQIMGHKPSATAEKHYKNRDVDQLRPWHERIEAWFLAQAGIVFEAAAEAPPAITQQQLRRVK